MEEEITILPNDYYDRDYNTPDTHREPRSRYALDNDYGRKYYDRKKDDYAYHTNLSAAEDSGSLRPSGGILDIGCSILDVRARISLLSY